MEVALAAILSVVVALGWNTGVSSIYKHIRKSHNTIVVKPTDVSNKYKVSGI